MWIDFKYKGKISKINQLKTCEKQSITSLRSLWYMDGSMVMFK